MSRLYAVELHGEATEVYLIEADSEEDARANWHQGTLDRSECYGMDVAAVRLEEDSEDDR